MQTFEYDDIDKELVASETWLVRSDGYVYSSAALQEHFLHRRIMQAPPHLEVDHDIDGDPTNNRRNNLRLATSQQNAANRVMPKLELTTKQLTKHLVSLHHSTLKWSLPFRPS